MIQIPAILREIASSGGSLYEKGPPSIAVLQIYDNYNNVKSWTHMAMQHKEINFDSWLEGM